MSKNNVIGPNELKKIIQDIKKINQEITKENYYGIQLNIIDLEELERKIIIRSQLLTLEKNHDDLLDYHDMSFEHNIINHFPNALLLENWDNKKNVKKNKITNDIREIPKQESIISETISPNNVLDLLNNLDNEKVDDKTSNAKICKGCGSKGTIMEDKSNGIIVCSQCGMVNDELLDYGPEWSQYNNDDNRKDTLGRCGCPSNFFFPKSYLGTIMAGSNSSRLNRKQTWNSMVYKERTLNKVFEFISLICSKNKIPKIIVDTARTLFKKISDCKHKSGRNIGKDIIIRADNRISVIAACVFKACEMNKNPRNIKEIADFFGLSEKKVSKGIRRFSEIIKNTNDDPILLDQYQNNTTEDYIRRHCPKLKISNTEIDMAVKISINCCKMKVASDHNPQSLAAGIVSVMVTYYNLNIDRKDIAVLFDTSDVTIGKIYNKIIPYVDALVDDVVTDHLIKKFKING